MKKALWFSRHAPSAAQVAEIAAMGYEIAAQEDGLRLGAMNLGVYVSMEEAETREKALRQRLTEMHDILVPRFWLQTPDECMKYVSRVNWSLLKENARQALHMPNV